MWRIDRLGLLLGRARMGGMLGLLVPGVDCLVMMYARWNLEERDRDGEKFVT